MLKTFMAEPVIFSLLVGTSSILRTFRAEPVKKHPVSRLCLISVSGGWLDTIAL